jgi:hypothetical protein
MSYQRMREFTILVSVALPEDNSEAMIEEALTEYMDSIEAVLPPFTTDLGGLRNAVYKE